MNNLEILCDIDEVVVNIVPKWICKCINDNKVSKRFSNDFMKKIYGLSGKELEAVVNERSVYYITDWIGCDSDVFEKVVMAQYTDDDEFYDDLNLTPFGERLVSMIKHESVGLTFITKCIGINIESKRRFIERHFGSVKIIEVPIDETKSSFINKSKLKFNLLIDDMVENINDILSNCVIKEGMTVLIPRLGYNQNLAILEKNIAKYKINLRVYKD